MKHHNSTLIVDTFPSVALPSTSGGVPIEVSLIAQLDPGAGTHLCLGVMSRQKQHNTFVDELEEPSAKLGKPYFLKGDPSSLYSFVVGPKGHPFHCHEGNRMFTAISGSAGTQLRFSTASLEEIEQKPEAFIQALRCVNIPPDCMFTVRFGSRVWHQFLPLARHTSHPTFFALSYHPDELAGSLSEEARQKVLSNEATIPSLTQLLPEAVLTQLNEKTFDHLNIPTTTLTLNAAAGTFKRWACNATRNVAGLLRKAINPNLTSQGFLTYEKQMGEVVELRTIPPDSLLKKHLADKVLHHEDMFTLSIAGIDVSHTDSETLLALLLESFLMASPRSVSYLMALRNLLVKPLGLRTSPLGCPVSSLLSDDSKMLFARQYPVLDQSIDLSKKHAQVLLGADDKHLIFRTCVSVKILSDQRVEFALGNRVHCTNLFGRFYIAIIDYVHRNYIVPLMLKAAVNDVLSRNLFATTVK